MSQETASLVLKSSDLTLNASTAIGTSDQFGTTLTWNNINLRTLLGDMYDKFDRFNLCLNTVASSIAGAYAGALEQRCNYITVSGLPWTNNTYFQSTGSNSNAAVIGSICIPASVTGPPLVESQITQYFYSNNTATFGKNQDICNITISFLKVLDNAKPTVTIAYPKFLFLFDIVGVEEYRVKDVTQSRLLK